MNRYDAVDEQRALSKQLPAERQLHGCRIEPALITSSRDPVDIRLISSLTDEDEDRFASALLQCMTDLLSTMPVAYNVRIETTGGNVLHRTRSLPEMPARADV